MATAATATSSSATSTSTTPAVTLNTVLVTGATRGIGLKLVERYTESGWNVIAAARDLARADQLKALSPYKIVQLDASDEASILRAAKELESEPIDLLINNAGIFTSNDLRSTTKDEMLQQFEVNTVGPFLVTRALLPNLTAAVAARGAAKVAHITSGLSSIANNSAGGMYAYRASKTALNMVNASLAADLKSAGIATVALSPGFVATEMNPHAGTISTDASITGLMRTIHSLSLENTGAFRDVDGQVLPW